MALSPTKSLAMLARTDVVHTIIGFSLAKTTLCDVRNTTNSNNANNILEYSFMLLILGAPITLFCVHYLSIIRSVTFKHRVVNYIIS